MPNVTARGSDWEPDQAAFHQLLALFHPDQEQAGYGYESLRQRLRDYFTVRRCLHADELVDETMNRLMRKLAAGDEIDHVSKFAYGIARLVALEAHRLEAREVLTGDDFPLQIVWLKDQVEDAHLRKCLIQCLENLSEEERHTFLTYTCPEDVPNKDARRHLAEELGITSTALRIRAYRSREKLELCLVECLGLKKQIS